MFRWMGEDPFPTTCNHAFHDLPRMNAQRDSLSFSPPGALDIPLKSGVPRNFFPPLAWWLSSPRLAHDQDVYLPSSPSLLRRGYRSSLYPRKILMFPTFFPRSPFLTPLSTRPVSHAGLTLSADSSDFTPGHPSADSKRRGTLSLYFRDLPPSLMDFHPILFLFFVWFSELVLLGYPRSREYPRHRGILYLFPPPLFCFGAYALVLSATIPGGDSHFFP